MRGGEPERYPCRAGGGLHHELSTRNRASGLGFAGGSTNRRLYAVQPMEEEDLVLERRSLARGLAGSGRPGWRREGMGSMGESAGRLCILHCSVFVWFVGSEANGRFKSSSVGLLGPVTLIIAFPLVYWAHSPTDCTGNDEERDTISKIYHRHLHVLYVMVDMHIYPSDYVFACI
jgi:hypothetical protein